MFSSRNLRWAGAGISNGRQRLSRFPASSRQFSLHTSPRHTSRPTTLLASADGARYGSARSLSLFGWGSSSKSSAGQDTIPDTSPADIEVGTSSISNLRTVKASHATSDFPDPSQVISTTDGAGSNPIERLSDAFALPADTGAFEEAQHNLIQTAATPEYVGYLREVCGLDYGWGPSTTMQWVFEHMHITGEYGWVASIVLLATLTRGCMVPAMIIAQKESQKIKALGPHLAPLREKYKQYTAVGDRAKMMEVGGEMRALNKAYNVKYSRMLVPLAIQLPFGFGAFRMLRGAGDLPVPGFIDLPWLWNSDLSLGDPYYIVPLLNSALIYSQFAQSQAQNSMDGSSPVTPQMQQLAGKVLPVMSLAFIVFQPGAVQLYFLTSSAYALASTFLLRQTWVRKRVGLNPLNDPTGTLTSPTSIPEKRMPGGMQNKRPHIIDVTAKSVPEVKESTSESLVEKGVDKVKSKFSNMKSGTAGAWSFAKEIYDSKSQKNTRQSKKQQNASFEDARARQLEIEREERNRRQSR